MHANCLCCVQDLLHRGIEAALVEEVLHSFFGEELRSLHVSRSSEEDGLIGSHPSALGDELLETARKKLKPMANLPVETQRRRLAGFVQRRGHSWDTAKQILQQLKLL